jgi:hypothetical protein
MRGSIQPELRFGVIEGISEVLIADTVDLFHALVLEDPLLFLLFLQVPLLIVNSLKIIEPRLYDHILQPLSSW